MTDHKTVTDQFVSDDQVKGFFQAYRALCREWDLEFLRINMPTAPNDHDCLIGRYRPDRDLAGLKTTVSQLYVYRSDANDR